MYVEENNPKLRVAIGTGLMVAAASLIAPTLNSILQSELVLWWVIILFIIGILILVTGLLILAISPSKWKCIWQSIKEFPQWLHESYIWKRYGPVCTIGEPETILRLTPDGKTRTYTAKVSVSIYLLEKCRNYFPVLVDLYTLVNLAQKQGGVKVKPVCLKLDGGTNQIILRNPGKHVHEMVCSFSLHNNPRLVFVDVKKSPFSWIVEGISVRLANISKFKKLRAKGITRIIE